MSSSASTSRRAYRIFLPAAAHEAPKLLLVGPSSPGSLLLEGAEGPKLTLRVNDLFHGGGTESADQLFLQVCVARVEAQPFHIEARKVGTEAGQLETAPESPSSAAS